jgi:ketosteroid isomerase-like protein
MNSSVDQIVDRFLRAIERADVDAVLAMYAPDATIWHNFDQVDMSPQDNARQLTWFTRRLSGMRYDDVRRVQFDGGVIQQHVLRGTAPNGDRVEVHAMLRIEVVGDRITRIEEYLDPAQAASLASSPAERGPRTTTA